MTKEITVGRINSARGGMYAQALDKIALRQIAQWAATASEALQDGDHAEQADAAFYLDVNCLINRLADHAA
jgi:hypothetical protein